MSSALPSHSESSSRNWWSLSTNKGSSRDPAAPYPSEKSARDLSSKRSDGTKLNLLASAIGFKSKKHPSLAIQDPPFRNFPPLPPSQVSYPSEPSPKYSNRPPSKSVSSTRSRVDSIEPRTPLDGQRDTGSQRNSLLTLSDADPFVSRGIAVPHSPIDPNRLSAYSGSSVVPEYITKKIDNAPTSRVSYASSSSYSNFFSDDPVSPISSIADKPRRMLSQKKSLGDIGQKSARQHFDEYPSGMIKSNSSSTLTDKNRLSHPDLFPAPRPVLRARGMTDAATTYQRTPFLQHSSLSLTSPSIPHSTSPRVIIRQPSIQRVGLPVSAPPNQKLPPPPAVDDETIDPQFSHSASSSTTSFRSSLREAGMVNQHYIPRSRPRERVTAPAEDSPESLHKARTLKKASSHQSISKIASLSNPSTLSTPATPVVETALDRGPRKQRSFHHPRIPVSLPPLPLSLKHQPASGIPFSDGHTSTETKRGSASGPPRKRLFSGSSTRRPSTSLETLDDDHRSVFSLDRERPSRSHSSNTKLSFWDEGGDVPSSPQASTAEYTPQQIMSPADMLKLEADVQESLSSSRQRGMSIMSTSTMTSDDNASSIHGHTVIRAVGLLNPQLHPIRSNSMGGGGVVVPPRLPRPSTSHSSSPIDTSPLGLVSLSPPPRPRRSQLSPNVSVISDVPTLKPLSPPPRTRTLSKKTSSDLNRRTSLMRKPSFLIIDDDLEIKKTPPPPIPLSLPVPPPLSREDSFLDLNRESLDTIRSDMDDEQF